MPRYRLIADHGHPADEFDADDAGVAERHARELSAHTATAKSTGYRLEQEVDGGWQVIKAWLPRRVSMFPGGHDTTVPADE